MKAQQVFEEARKQGYPKFYDSDLICNICGEPWDYYGVRMREDMTEKEAQRFGKGKGCPGCKGEKKIE